MRWALRPELLKFWASPCVLDPATKVARVQWIEDGAGGAGGRVGKSAVYFFCGHVFDEDTCEQRPGTGEFVCAHCAVDPAKQRIRRGMEAGEVRRP